MSTEHDGLPARHVARMLDEPHAEFGKAADDPLVVHDLVDAIHRRSEAQHGQGQRLDRHLDAGTEAARLDEEHTVSLHATNLVLN